MYVFSVRGIDGPESNHRGNRRSPNLSGISRAVPPQSRLLRSFSGTKMDHDGRHFQQTRSGAADGVSLRLHRAAVRGSEECRSEVVQQPLVEIGQVGASPTGWCLMRSRTNKLSLTAGRVSCRATTRLLSGSIRITRSPARGSPPAGGRST